MEIIGRTLFLVLCVFGAYALPNFAGNNEYHGNSVGADGMYQMLLSQMRAAFIDVRALSPGEASCANYYNNRVQQINNQLTNQTNDCFERANNTRNNNEWNANVTANSIRGNLNLLQQRLANCSVIQDIPTFINCTTSTFDKNLELLDNANSKSYQLSGQFVANQTQVDVVRDDCVNAAVNSVKTNLTLAANDYNVCLLHVPNQRDETVMKLLN